MSLKVIENPVRGSDWDQDTTALIDQRWQAGLIEWTEEQIKSIAGLDLSGSWSLDLGFSSYMTIDFAACTVCGAVFARKIKFLRRHRLSCGWSA